MSSQSPFDWTFAIPHPVAEVVRLLASSQSQFDWTFAWRIEVRAERQTELTARPSRASCSAGCRADSPRARGRRLQRTRLSGCRIVSWSFGSRSSENTHRCEDRTSMPFPVARLAAAPALWRGAASSQATRKLKPPCSRSRERSDSRSLTTSATGGYFLRLRLTCHRSPSIDDWLHRMTFARVPIARGFQLLSFQARSRHWTFDRV